MSFELVEGDCVERMAEMGEASIDAVVCDPPYELGFMGKEWDRSGVAYQASTWREAYRILKPGGHLLAFGGTRTYHRLACAIEDAGFEIRDSLIWLYGSGFPKSRNLEGDWQGWGTALKPAHEPIVVARKPLSGTVAANVLAHGTGALNVDGCRVGFAGKEDERTVREAVWHATENAVYEGAKYHANGDKLSGADSTPESGRWPANVILSPESADELDEQSGEQVSGTAIQRNGGGRAIFGGIAGNEGDGPTADAGYGDSGGASRFFYCAKASAGERNAGLDGFEARSDPAHRRTNLETADRPHLRGLTKRRNVHPTVKPVDLMRWLVRLVTPPDGTVLDPFTGSGTTGVAAVLEGFDFVGIEREAEYVRIAEARLEWWSRIPVGTATEKALGVAVSERQAREVGQSPLFP